MPLGGNFLEVALISGVCYNDMGKKETEMGTDQGHTFRSIKGLWQLKGKRLFRYVSQFF